MERGRQKAHWVLERERRMEKLRERDLVPLLRGWLKGR